MRRLCFVFLLCISAAFLRAQDADAGNATDKYLFIYFAWENACEACRDDAEFYEFFTGEISDIPDRPLLGFNALNVFKEGNRRIFDELCGTLGIEGASLPLPVLIIGDEYLAGDEAIRRGARDLYLRQKDSRAEILVRPAYLFDSQSTPQAEAKAPQDFPATGPDNSVLVCFVTTACENCEKTKAFLRELPPNITLADGSSSSPEIYYFNVAEREGLPAAWQFFISYKVPSSKQLVPIVFYAGGYLAGHEEIEKNLNGVLVSGAARGFVYPGSAADAPELAWRELPAIFLAGLLGGLNPCSVSVFLLLLLLLFLLASKMGMHR
jgi:hypothetical protein